jgi:hypothetical protein
LLTIDRAIRAAGLGVLVMRGVLFGLAVAALATPAFAADIVNGDFEAGNVGFTSAYAFIPPVPGGNTAAAQYTITTDAFPWTPNFASYGDHTTGTGNYMVVNGAGTAETVWQNAAPVLLDPGTYRFSFFLSDACCNTNFNGGAGPGIDPAPPMLQISLNGSLISATNLTVSPPAGVWHLVSEDFQVNSPGAAATFSIVNNRLDPNGNDFALDDLHVSAVPEPTSWALMLLGFGGLGAALRARRRTVAATA